MCEPSALRRVTSCSDVILVLGRDALFDLAIGLLRLFGCGWMLDEKVAL